MNTQIDFNDIPKNYLYCTHNKCSRHSKCLRYQAALCIPQTTPYYSAVNPNHIAGDNIPHAMAVTIRKEMYSLMGRNMYYRIRNKERLLHPDEQKQIAAIFSKHGIKFKPAFDKYIEKYDW